MIEGKIKQDFSIEKPEWAKVEGDTFTVDHVIHAYLSGQEKAISRVVNAVEKVRDQNLIKSMGLTDEFLSEIKQKLHVDFVQARIAQPDFNIVKAIVILHQEDYFSKKLDQIYDLYFSIEDNLDLDFDFSIKITFADNHINFEQMSLDGYRYFRKPS